MIEIQKGKLAIDLDRICAIEASDDMTICYFDGAEITVDIKYDYLLSLLKNRVGRERLEALPRP